LKGRWNPYLVGIGIGVLSWLAFAIVNELIGISTSLSSVSSLCAMPVSFSWVEAHIQNVAALGTVRLPDITGARHWGWFGILIAIAAVLFWLLETKMKPVAP
jgi:hypothetical protein